MLLSSPGLQGEGRGRGRRAGRRGADRPLLQQRLGERQRWRMHQVRALREAERCWDGAEDGRKGGVGAGMSCSRGSVPMGRVLVLSPPLQAGAAAKNPERGFLGGIF